MPNYELMMAALNAVWFLFVIAFGGCVGSLINVLVYRMPRGLSVVTPPSRCPKCDTRLSWRDNIPVLGWLILRGKCRYCSNPISAEYPIVEAIVAGLFGLVFIAFFVMPPDWNPAGIPIGAIRPEWAENEITKVWPYLVVILLLLGSLTAMTIIDARTFTIPMALTTFPVLVALAIHPLLAVWSQSAPSRQLFHFANENLWPWVMPIPGPGQEWWVGASVGGCVGLVISWLLVKFGLLRRSFADYEEWEKQAIAEANSQAQAPTPESDALGGSALPAESSALGTSGRLTEPTHPEPVAGTPDIWIQYPHARREMFYELLYLAPCLGLLILGGWLAQHFWGGSIDAETGAIKIAAYIPLWIRAIAGVMMGYLVGGGVVWGVRILGSVAFGKEAMGLGDVHLLAAVGACIGWIDAFLTFFLAAFVGVLWQIAVVVAFRKVNRAMPYGPYLAVAVLLVLLGKPLIEAGLSRMFGTPVNLP